MGLNPDAVGKTYQAAADMPVTAELAAQYADATSASALYPDGAIPPMLIVRFLLPGLTAAVLDPELGADLLRLVHGEQSISWKTPMRVGDKVSVESKIVNVEQKETGETATVDIVARADDRVLAEGTSLIFIRKPRPKGERGAGTPEAPEPSPPTFEAKVTVADDQSIRYAEASGDHNPIHTDPNVAQAAGLPGVILHGLCTMAFAHNALVEHAAGGDASKVSAFAVRFKRPVLMGDTLTITGTKTDDDVKVEVHNQDGTPVLVHGSAQIG